MVKTTNIADIEVDPATGLAKGYKVTPAKLISNRANAVQSVKSPLVGRPPTYKDDELPLFEQRITDYFADCEDKGVPATTYGLALALHIDRDTLMRYGEGERDNEETDPEGLGRMGFSAAVKRAKLYLRAQTEQTLMSGKATVGAIFWLKNCAGWKDQQEQVHNTGIQVIISPGIVPAVESRVESHPLPPTQPASMLTIDVSGLPDSVSAGPDED